MALRGVGALSPSGGCKSDPRVDKDAERDGAACADRASGPFGHVTGPATWSTVKSSRVNPPDTAGGLDRQMGFETVLTAVHRLVGMARVGIDGGDHPIMSDPLGDTTLFSAVS